MRVRTLKPHDTAVGMKWPGEEYDRTVEDATFLSGLSIVEAIDQPPGENVASAAAPPIAKPRRGRPADGAARSNGDDFTHGKVTIVN